MWNPALGATGHMVTSEEEAVTTNVVSFSMNLPGLHFEDVRILLNVFQRLSRGRHSLVVIDITSM